MRNHPARSLTLTVLGIIGTSQGLASAEPGAAPAAHVDETQQNEAALRAIAQHWGDAELEGDVGYLERLLAPEYRSIGPKGASHPRALILEHASHSHGAAEARKARDAYMQAHPTEMAVTLHGAFAIVAYFNPHRGLDASIRGSDMFVYEGNRWHAVYSMHNDAE